MENGQSKLLTVHSPFSGERHGGQKASESCSRLHLSIKENTFIDGKGPAGRKIHSEMRVNSEVGLAQKQSQGWQHCPQDRVENFLMKGLLVQNDYCSDGYPGQRDRITPSLPAWYLNFLYHPLPYRNPREKEAHGC